ncbi:hypothetical protein [Fusobacterium polymorphum]|jgi:hypothetical protein|uniref:hypothetical protein n=1 Tax=Fusobacterium nucleatum subsp. polymorphum TaxID=76857 RepID=UPI00300B25D3
MENIEKNKIIDEEIEKLKKEILANEDEIIKIKKDQEKNNKKIGVRRNNIELLKGKIALKELEKREIIIDFKPVPEGEVVTENNQNEDV